MDKRVLMLHQFHQPHPAHRVFGDAVGAEYYHFETGEPIGGPEANLNSMLARLRNAISLDSYDVVIGEGTTPIYTLLFYKLLNTPSADVIPLFADETFMKIRHQRTHHIWRHLLSKPMSAAMSGSIVVGELCQSWASKYLDIPFEVVHPPIAQSKYDLLEDVSPAYEIDDTMRILHAGTVSDRAAVRKKNSDVLAEAVSQREDWGLTLLGSGHTEYEYSGLRGVSAPGYLETLSAFTEEFSRAHVYVQPSTGDAFPVASLEGMLAGLPTVVSEGTGTKEIVEAVDPNLVCPPTVAGVQQALDYVRSLSSEERRARGMRLRKRVSDLTEQNQGARFASAIERLTS